MVVVVVIGIAFKLSGSKSLRSARGCGAGGASIGADALRIRLATLPPPPSCNEVGERERNNKNTKKVQIDRLWAEVPKVVPVLPESADFGPRMGSRNNF